MKYKLVQRTSLQKRTESKWYASLVNEGKITQKAIAAEIAESSSLSFGDVANVFEKLLDIVPKHLLTGKSVNLGNFGTMRLDFKSEGVTDPSKFNPETISGLKVVFTPSMELKAKLGSVSYEL